MPGPAQTVDQNILPVQAYFNLDGSFNTFIGQGQPFVISATESISITNSTVNATLYPTFTSSTGGQITGLGIASSSLTWNPGTGVFSAPTFFGTLNGTANTANNLSGGGAGQIVYQNALGSTAYLGAGSTGQFLSSNGTSAPSWATIATSVTISDQTTDTATYYPLFYSATSGSTNTVETSSTKLQYVPSTGTFKSTVFSGSGASLTNIPNGALTNSSVTIGSTSIALGGTSTTLSGLTSVTATTFTGSLVGNASTATTATNATNSAITDNTSSSGTFYPTLVTTTSGNQPLNTSSTKLSFQPSTSTLTASIFSGAATNIYGGTTNQIAVQSAANTTTFIVAPTVASTVLNWTGSAFSWVAQGSGSGSVTSVAATVPSFLSITGSPITTSGTLAISYSGTALPGANGGTGQTGAFVAGGIVYGSSTTALAVSAVGTTGQVLQSNGTSAPTWVTAPASAAGGSTTQVQYNSSGVLAGSANMTFNGTTLTLVNDASISGMTVGKGTGSVATNTATGYQALLANTTGGANTAYGYQTLKANTTGGGNTAVGNYSLQTNTTGGSNTAFGNYSLQFNTTGGNNVAIGYLTLQNNTISSNLVAIGYSSLVNNTTAVATLGTITGGSGYTNGTYTGVVMTLSSGSTALTYPTATIVVAGGVVTTVTITSAGKGFQDTTTVLTATSASIGGTGSGFTVPVATLASGTSNTAIGYSSLNTNTTGSSNTAIGFNGLTSNTTGSSNVGVGGFALNKNTTGSSNISIGSQALFQNITGSNNTAIGDSSLQNTTGNNNTAYGYQAGNTNTTGTNNLIIGYNAQGSSATVSNEITIGNSSNTVIRYPHNYSTVASLPSASTVGRGSRTFVTDALAPVFQATVTGGGAVFTPVYSDGTNWKVG